MLLHHEAGRTATSFVDMRTTSTREGRKVWETYREACAAHGLLADDTEWDTVMNESAVFMGSLELRRLFAALLSLCSITEPFILFTTHLESMAEGFPDDLDEGVRRAMVQLDLLEHLAPQARTAHTWLNVSDGLRAAVAAAEAARGLATVVAAAGGDLSVEARTAALERAVTGLARLRPSQKEAVFSVLGAIGAPSAAPGEIVVSVRQLLLFCDAPAGTGKTTVLNVLIDAAEADGKVVIRVASTGIAAVQLRGGRTFHSQMKAPIRLDKDTFFNVPSGSPIWRLLESADLLIWDEAPYMHRWLLEGLDRTLRDIRRSAAHFGGLTVVQAGDFRQCLPVVKRGNAAAVVAASMRRSVLWPHFEVLSFTDNMRVLARFPDDPRALRWAEWLLLVGNGRLPGTRGAAAFATDVMLADDSWPELIVDSLEEMVQFVFPDLSTTMLEPPAPADLGTILTPHNATVKLLNESVYHRFPGIEEVMCSADALCDGVEMEVPLEVLNAHENPTLPPHRLCLKPGVPVTLLRNLDPARQLMNGTLLIFHRSINGVLLECSFASDAQRKVYLHRMPLDPPDDVFEVPWRRRQFPVKLAFAMTINKSQGKTLNKVGLYLRLPCFGHGQLYVALSRVGHPDHLRVCFYDTAADEDIEVELRRGTTTSNVVYSSALLTI